MTDAKTPAGIKAPSTGRWARTATAGVASARVASLAVRQRWRGDTSASAQAAAEAEMGRVLLGAMSQMRGTALKAAQMLSMDSSFLPEGIKSQLAKASHQVIPLNRALIGKVFRREFGQEPEQMFETFEPLAFAAASLGQVHRARLADGRWVAVKIQYPGMAATIETDLSLLRTTLRRVGNFLTTLPDPEVVDSLLAEIRGQLLEEVDYRLEAQRQQAFAARLDDPRLVVAEVIHSHTRSTVLTQTLLPGQHLADWLANRPAAAVRNAQGQALFDWFTRCAFERGHIQADLHAGNVLFLDDGRVGLLDFGCTRHLSPGFVQAMAQSWCSYVLDAELAPGLLRAYKALGLVQATLELAQFEAEILPTIAPVLAWATEPLAKETFDFASKSSLPRPTADTQSTLARHLNAMPPEMLSMDRAWFGLMHLLQGLGAQVDTRSALQWLQMAAQGKGAGSKNAGGTGP